MRILYLDCPTGAAGDMLLGALLDAGVPEAEVRSGLATLPFKLPEIRVERTTKKSISGTKLTVVPEPAPGHRHLPQILDIIAQSGISPWAAAQCTAIFRRLAEAEAKIHGTTPDKIHFHEIGALDSLVDIIGTVLALEILAPDRIICSPLPLGKGFVHCDHGIIPVPAPATLELLKGIPVCSTELEGELVTPTAAVLLAAFVSEWTGFPAMKVEAVGYGAGTRELPVPNLLRAVIGNREAVISPNPASYSFVGPFLAGLEREELVMVETNIDDMNAEFYPYVMEKCLTEGALDAFWQPLGMKKGRPGSLLSVLVRADKVESIARVLLTETSTLGVRTCALSRYSLPRSIDQVDTTFGPIRVKSAFDPQTGNCLRQTPEYEDCRRAAALHGIPLQAVYREALQAAALIKV
ncbi:MAG TPA: nickel pincer cofactor biosynthesis protein LarC [Bacillota bacterium]|nr:nickel pincer cofactor biosynthesis protein LarC [Bacillota bacterium]